MTLISLIQKGLSFEINDKNQLYASYARANREPNRTDYENGSPRPEKLNDLEFGLRHNTQQSVECQCQNQCPPN
jgi:outer membrane cobalamin receptor